MKVVVAGLPNTGIEAVEEALRHLGYDVYGWEKNVLHLAKEWSKILNDHGSIKDIRDMFKNADAVADVPACYFWEEILQAYPDAKIIFTRHGDEDEWTEEMAERIRQEHSDCDKEFLNMTSPTMCNINKKLVIPMERLVYGFSPPSLWSKLTVNKSLLRKRYRAHCAHVMENAPKDQLLVYNVSDGWKPLCQFLGVSVPGGFFPTVKDAKAVAKDRLESNSVFCKAKKEQKIMVSLFLMLGGFGAYKLFKNPPNFLERACDWIQESFSSVFKKA